MNFKQILVELVEKKGSDLHLRVGLPPVIRLNGELTKLGSERTTVEDIDAALSTILTPDQLAKLKTNPELDLALSVSKLGRFRINIYRQRGTFSLALRTVNTDVPTFEQLNLPTVMKEIAESRRGLIIVTGTTGSGKSTTLAALIERINSTRAENILTIEDPIEYVYRDQLSIISQREIGGDTNSFTNALRAAFRQDPDVILVGEIRDIDTMNIALTAADTGHLVLTTLHTLNAVETINRIISFFPPHQHHQVRLLVSGTLRAIISQRLIPRSDIAGRIPAVEILRNTASIKDAILDPEKTIGILDLIESGHIQYGMQSFDQSIMNHYRQGIISYQQALNYTTNPDDFELRVKGITGASDRGWNEFKPVG
ncbi:MAG: type IV pili twitching motility protein PilT [candidate division Zixibacteria bacterium CG_4_9_14_3_um_filter_46_8]|nr:MAG: type IV pili twitching motility protein PilT [candidate division Zixibacteria bacterium CG_4_9_14_3_um_filter_46_8]